MANGYAAYKSKVWSHSFKKLLRNELISNKLQILVHQWLSWLSIGLSCGRSRVQTSAVSTLRILK